MARFLVTGGAGFIGSNLVETLLRRGHDVRALDDFSSGRRENLAPAVGWSEEGSSSFELIEGDVRDAQACRQAVESVDYVLHLAAIPSVQRSVEDPVGSNDVNVHGTLRVLEAARAARTRRVVFASSSAIYGDCEELPTGESVAPDPISPYGLQKLAGESYCRMYHRLYGVPTVALRYFNVFGPRQDPRSEYSAVIPRFLAAASRGDEATVYGDGEQTRDFLFVENVVEANLLACEAGEASLGSACNIACGERVSLNDLLARIGELLGGRVARRHDEPRSGDIRHSVASVELANRLLGFRPTLDLSEGLRRTIGTV